MATQLRKEQEELRSILNAPGAVGVGGVPLGGAFTGTPGTDITQASPATTQLLEESIKTRTGQIGEAIESSRAFTGVTPRPITEPGGTTPAATQSQGTDTSAYSQANPYAPGSQQAIAWEQRNQPAPERAALPYEAPAPRSLEEIRREQLSNAQSIIDATESVFQQEIERLRQQGEEAMARTSSIQIGRGLAGSSFAGAAEAKTQDATNEVLRARENERRAEVAKLMAAAQDQATAQYDKEIARFQQEREFAASERDSEIVRQAANKAATASSLATMGASGLSIDDMDAGEYRQLLADSGMSDFEARAIWSQSTPGANAKYEIQGNNIVGIYYDPVTGQPVVTTTALPEGMEGVAGADPVFYTDGQGQGFMADRSNPTYDENGNLVMHKIGAQDPVEEPGLPEAPKIQKFGEDDYRQWNAETQEWDTVSGTDPTDDGPTVAEAYQAERAGRIIAQIESIQGTEDIESSINEDTVGFYGWTASKIPGTKAFDLAREIESIKANIGFNELTAMREASKTGGALGQVAVQEIEFLQAVLGSLNQGQSVEQFNKNLQEIKDTVIRWNEAAAAGTTTGTEQAPTSTSDTSSSVADDWGDLD